MQVAASDGFSDPGWIGAGSVVVMFSARWCRPCHAMARALEEIGEDMPHRLRAAVIDVEATPGLPASLGVRGLPTIMIFKDGMLAATRVGELPRSALEDWIDAVV